MSRAATDSGGSIPKGLPAQPAFAGHADRQSTATRQAGWRWVKLGEVCENVQSGFASGQRDPEGVIQLRMNNLDTRGNFVWDDFIRVPASHQTVAQFRLELNDVLFNNTNSKELVGKSALFTGYGEDVVFSNHFTRIRTCPDALIPGFLAAWLNQQWLMGIFASICNSWIGQSAVKPSRLLSLEIPLPSLPEQKRIAAILNEQMAAVERARKAAQEQLATADALPAVYMAEVFDGKGAKSWPAVRFEELAFLQRGYDLPASWQVTGRYPIMTSAGQTGTHAEFRAKGPGVVTGRSGSVGRVHYVETDYWPHNTSLFVKDFKGNHPRFVFYLLRWMGIQSVGSGSGVPTLDRKQVHKLRIPRPPVEEQVRVCRHLDQMIARAETLKAAIARQTVTINTLPAAFLRRAFAPACAEAASAGRGEL